MHARNARALGVGDLVLLDADPATAAAVAAETDARTLPSLADVIAAAPDAAVVSTPTPAHAELVRALLESSIPTLCEKPLAPDLATTEALGETATRTGTLLRVGFQRRFDADLVAARRAVLDGAVGRPYLLRLCSHDRRPVSARDPDESGSIFGNLLIHDFDAARWLTGLEVTSVHGERSVLAIPHATGPANYDVAVAVLTLRNGSLAVVSGSRGNPAGHDVRLEILGSVTSISAGLSDRSPLGRIVDGTLRVPGTPYQGYRDRFAGAFRLELRAFLRAAAGIGPGGGAGTGEAHEAAGWRDSYEALRIALAAERSVRDDRRVEVATVR
jgi:myo-inositol 2-dehydrogenase/D-chiro-inositol 1-dehydrogenase